MPEIDLGQVVGPQGPQGPAGPQGPQGVQGPAGAAATINGVNALTVEGSDTLDAKMNGSKLTLSAKGWSNQKLLDNWYFLDPINQRGQTEYKSSGGKVYTIDRWFISGNQRLSLEDGYIRYERMIAGAYSPPLAQSIEGPLTGTYTLSVLFRTNNSSTRIGLSKNSATLKTLMLPNTNGAWDLAYITADNVSINADEILNVTIAQPMLASGSVAGDYIDIIAAKLELGSVQTLAHKEGDEWVLNEIPNYAEQYAICEQYSPITGEFVGGQHSNKQMLDNAYWANKDFIINQRGETEYTKTGHTIDRWIVVNNPGLAIVDGGITIENGVNLIQRIDPGRVPPGSTVTFSLLVELSDGRDELLCGTTTWTGGYKALVTESNTKSGIRLAIQATENYVQIYNAKGDKSSALKAAKLELGPVQTLAHKEGDNLVLNDPPPNYALELAKCQRYYRIYATESMRPSNPLDCNPVMRASPTQGTIFIDGTTYYYNDANL